MEVKKRFTQLYCEANMLHIYLLWRALKNNQKLVFYAGVHLRTRK